MLSDPLIVDAAETLFVPNCVYNNVAGPDAEVLAAFDEPTWNNPVVRIIDAEGHDVVPRNGRDWTRSGVATAMIAALQGRDRAVPAWLELLAWQDDAERRGVSTAIFGMT